MTTSHRFVLHGRRNMDYTNNYASPAGGFAIRNSSPMNFMSISFFDPSGPGRTHWGLFDLL